MAKQAFKYDASSIDVNLGLDAVREAPQIYIGYLDSDGLLHLAKELLDNASDEANQDAVKDKYVGIITEGDAVWVFDAGRGIPVEKHKTTKISTLTTIMTTLSSGGKMRSGKEAASYKKTAGVHGVGVSVTNALSAKMEVWTYRDKSWYYQAFIKGRVGKDTPIPRKMIPPILPHVPKQYSKPSRGTIIKFTPDFTLFDKGSKLPLRKLRELLQINSYLHPKLKFIWAQPDRVREYSQPKGLVAYVQHNLEELKAEAIGKTFEYHDDDVDVAMVWSNAVDESTRSYVNGSPTKDGGSHIIGLNKAIAEALVPFRTKTANKYRAEDLRAGLVCVINIGVDKPRFTNQTKEKLDMPQTVEQIRRSLVSPLMAFFGKNKTMARDIIKRAVEQNKANKEFSLTKKAIADMRTSKQGKVMLPSKLANALSNIPEERELFLVEGESAGGTAKNARIRQYQAVLPVYGKVLNVIKASPSKIVANKPIRDVLQAIGYDGSRKDPFSNIQYGKVILLADADSDGEHISLLLSGVFQKILQPLIEAGKLYVGDSPLFTAQLGTRRFYAATRRELEKQLPKNSSKVNITRVKGLGELNPPQLHEVAFNPATRKLKRILPVKGKRLQRFLNVLGADTDFRKVLLGVGNSVPVK